MRLIVGLVAVATALCFGSGEAHAAAPGTCASGAVTAPFSPQRQPCPLSSVEEGSLKPKDVFKECDKGCPEMVVVPAVAFTMGSPENETGRGNSEGPQYKVTIGQAFAVGRSAVTFGEWDACVADGGCGGYRPDDQGWGRGRRPVINVSWNDAKIYLQWLSKKTGHQYRLLSEAEREYVTGAGTTTAFWLGAGITVRKVREANYNSSDTYIDNDGENGEYWEWRLSVGSTSANQFGLNDVNANVWQWLEDYGSGDDGSNDYQAFSGIHPPEILRATCRNRVCTVSWVGAIGFRVARTLAR